VLRDSGIRSAKENQIPSTQYAARSTWKLRRISVRTLGYAKAYAILSE
jgi:hypothetical protein